MLSLTDSGDQLGTNAATVVCPALSKIYIVKNAVGQAATLKTASGTGIAIPNGKTMVLFCDGTNVEEAINNFTGALTTAAITASGAVSVDDATDTTSGTTGSIHTDGGLGVAKNLFVATNATVSGTTLMTGVATHGDDVVSDTDSTDDLGTTGVRWANLFVDAITATDQITATGFTGTLDGILGSGTPAAATVTQLTSGGVIVSDTDSTDDLGTTGVRWRALYVDAITATDQITATGFTGTLDGILGSGTPAAASVTTLTASGDITANNFAGRNLIINGDMAIAQRGTSIVTPTNTVYLLDRYKYFISGTTAAVTVTQDSDMPAGHVGFSMKFDCTTADASVAAGDVAGFHYYVEGFDSAHLAAGTAAAKTITISFWVKSPKTGGHGVIVKNGANNRAYPASYTVSVADTWEYKTMTVAMDTSGTWIGATNGIGLGLYFPLIAGSNFTDPADAWVAAECYGINSGVNILDNAANNFYLTELQVEVGTAATEFERIPYEVLLAKCQRYLPMFEFDTTDNMTGFVGQNVSTTVALIGVPFPVKTRVKPTGVTVSGAAHFSLTQAGSGRVASTAVAVQTVSGRLAGALNITVGSGLIAGEATTLWSNSAGAKFYFTGCEL
tara:strand:+ start:4290 stop:6140 length:1851 start_codon:yes stop_codon:yes gene_type:complete